jgi:hypothetical protein
MAYRRKFPHPLPDHPEFSDRDTGGRFTAGNAGRPPGTAEQREASRLRVQAQKAVAADFLRHMEPFMADLRATHQREYLHFVLNTLNEADDRPGAAEAHAPTCPPLDVPALIAEGRADRIAKDEAWEAKKQRWEAAWEAGDGEDGDDDER